MCDPVTILATVAVATAGAGVYGQYEQAKIQNKVFAQNQENAIVAARDAYDAEAAESNQRREVAGQDAAANAIAAARARASASAAATENGISGISIDALINDITRQEGTNYVNLAANESFARDQRVRSGRAIQSQAQDRINSVQGGSFNPILAGIQIIGAGAQGYASGTAVKASNAKTQ